MPENLSLPMEVAPSKKPKVDQSDLTTMRVSKISTAKLIAWLQKKDPSGRLQVHADNLDICRPEGRGSFAIIAQLEIGG